MVHEGKRPFVCRAVNGQGEECGAGFDAAGKLKSHQGRVHGDKRFWCTICSSTAVARESNDGEGDTQDGFSTYAELQAHIGIQHAPTCEECGLQCKSHRALKSHVDIVHGPSGVDERRKHACGEPGCGRAFTKKGNLNVHVRTIHDQRKFVCGDVDRSLLKNVAGWDGSNACGQALSTKQSLEGHIRAAHLGLSSSRRNTDDLTAERKKTRSRAVSTLVRLTGAGYDRESGRDISCMMPNCEYRFTRDYDLELHLSFYHGLSNDEMESRWTAFRSTWDGSLILASGEDLEAEHVLDMQFGMAGIQAGFQEEHVAIQESGAEHMMEEKGDEFHAQRDHDVEMIDPTLR